MTRERAEGRARKSHGAEHCARADESLATGSSDRLQIRTKSPAAPAKWPDRALPRRLLGQAACALLFLVSLVGPARALYAGQLWAGESALLLLMACPILFKLSLNVLLSQRSDYMNVVSVFCVPFVMVAIGLLRTDTREASAGSA